MTTIPSITIGNWQGFLGRDLAARELEAVLHCANERTVKEAAREMQIAPDTVAKRLLSAKFKLGVSSLRGAVLEAFRRGLISPSAGVLALLMAVHSMASDDSALRIRRNGGGERKIETRIAARRVDLFTVAA